MLPFEGVIDAAIAQGQAIIERLNAGVLQQAEDYRYGWRTARDLAQLAGSGATLWALYRHKRIAYPLSVGTAAVTAGLSAMSSLCDPPLPEDEGISERELFRNKIVRTVVDSASSVFGALSIGLSSSARGKLTEAMDLSPRNPATPFTRGEIARNAASLYMAYTIVGHWLEMAFCQLIRLGIVDGEYDRSDTMLWDWWLHPFPAEGIAGLLIAGALSPLREVLLRKFGGRVLPALAVSFLVNQAVCTAIDYTMGMIANRNYELWDYRDMPFNFQGQICLQNSLVYSTAATLITWLAYPARDSWLRRMPADLVNINFAAMAPTYAFLCLVYFV